MANTVQPKSNNNYKRLVVHYPKRNKTKQYISPFAIEYGERDTLESTSL